MTRMMVKMAAVSAIAVLFLCCSAVTAAESQDCNINVATNENAIVPLGHTLQVSDHLKWRRGDEIIFYRRGTHIHTGTASDVDQNGSLKLTNVTKDKAGEYTPEVHDGSSGKAVTGLKKKRLCVSDRVPKPAVKIECPSTSNVKFTCGVPKGTKDVKFEWLQSNKVVDKGEILQKKITDDVKTATFTCRVSNLVSNWTSSPVTQNCTKGFIFPDKVLGINTWIFVGGGGGVVLILIIIVIACCIRNKRRQRLQIKDEEELRLGWTNPSQQHHHHHQHNHPPNQHHHHPHHHHQQQPAGHTGPRQHRSKQQRGQQHPRDTNNPNGQPQPSPRRPAQAPKPPVDDGDEVPPPLPQPRKKAPKTPRA